MYAPLADIDMFWPEPFSVEDTVRGCHDQWGVRTQVGGWGSGWVGGPPYTHLGLQAGFLIVPFASFSKIISKYGEVG